MIAQAVLKNRQNRLRKGVKWVYTFQAEISEDAIFHWSPVEFGSEIDKTTTVVLRTCAFNVKTPLGNNLIDKVKYAAVGAIFYKA